MEIRYCREARELLSPTTVCRATYTPWLCKRVNKSLKSVAKERCAERRVDRGAPKVFKWLCVWKFLKMETSKGGKTLLNFISPNEVSLEIKDPVDTKALEDAKAIIAEIKTKQGFVDSDALLRVAKRLQDLPSDVDTYIVSKQACQDAYDTLSDLDRNTLNNLHRRIKAFAEAQRASICDVTIPIPGGEAGHTVSPCSTG